ncbi:MAG: methionyl-tRNA formyltransferase [Microthrixaceae bacterium]
MRLVYLGSPAISVPALDALVDAGHDVALVVTNPPRRRGRRGAPTPTDVGARANELGLEVSHELADATGVGAELGVVVAFGRLVPVAVLDSLPMLNLHFSLLPRWRGAAPVERAILAGDTTTGVCVMAVEEGLDSGGVYARAEVGIGERATAAELSMQLSALGAGLLVDTLAGDLGPATPQNEVGVTYAAKLSAADRELHWSDDALALDRVVRIGGAWTTLDGSRLKVLEAVPSVPQRGGAAARSEQHPDLRTPGRLRGAVVECGSGSLELVRVQPEGRSEMDVDRFLNGARLAREARLGT